MQNQAEKVIDLLESGIIDTRILNDIGCCESPLPLYKLSLCNEILLDDDNWSESFLPIVECNRKGCKAHFWITGRDVGIVRLIGPLIFLIIKMYVLILGIGIWTKYWMVT